MKINIKATQKAAMETGISEVNLMVNPGEIYSIYKVIERIEQEENKKIIEINTLLSKILKNL